MDRQFRLYKKCDPKFYGTVIEIIKINLAKAGWDGDGEIAEIWIPPFVLSSILDEEIKEGYNLVEDWKTGFVLWYVKQKSDGLSFICSLKKLKISEYAL